MFIDYLAVMLINLGAGLALLAHYLYVKPPKETRRGWATGFLAVGLLGLVTSLPVVLTWPLPGGSTSRTANPPCSSDSGDLRFLRGGLRDPSRDSHRRPAPRVRPAGRLDGVLLTGVGGILVLPTLQGHENRTLTITTAIILGLAALLWLYTGYLVGWGHVLDFSKYVPGTMVKK